MGIVLDSSVVIAAERKGQQAAAFIVHVSAQYPDQSVALSAIAYTELLRGLYRTSASRRKPLDQILTAQLATILPVLPYTREVAEIAAKVEHDQALQGIAIPFADLLIGATALANGFAILTANERHFSLIPGLEVISFWH